jgi:FMN reductase
MKRIVVITAGLSVPSSTRLLADLLGDAVERSIEARGAEVEVETIELRPLAHALADHLLTGFPSGDLAAAIDRAHFADGLVVVTPVFAASYSGLFKTFFDVLDKDALDGKPVLIAATAGTARHSLVLEHALRPLFSYLHAVVVPTGVFAATDDFGTDGALRKRIERAATELAALVAVGASGTPAPATPPAEPVTPFEQLLREAGGDSVR